MPYIKAPILMADDLTNPNMKWTKVGLITIEVEDQPHLDMLSQQMLKDWPETALDILASALSLHSSLQIGNHQVNEQHDRGVDSEHNEAKKEDRPIPSQPRRIVYDFFTLSYPVRIKILYELNLVKDEDERIEESVLIGRALERAIKTGKLEQLAKTLSTAVRELTSYKPWPPEGEHGV